MSKKQRFVRFEVVIAEPVWQGDDGKDVHRSEVARRAEERMRAMVGLTGLDHHIEPKGFLGELPK